MTDRDTQQADDDNQRVVVDVDSESDTDDHKEWLNVTDLRDKLKTRQTVKIGTFVVKNAETRMIIKNTTAEDTLFEEIFTKLIIGIVNLLLKDN